MRILIHHTHHDCKFDECIRETLIFLNEYVKKINKKTNIKKISLLNEFIYRKLNYINLIISDKYGYQWYSTTHETLTYRVCEFLSLHTDTSYDNIDTFHTFNKFINANI